MCGDKDMKYDIVAFECLKQKSRENSGLSLNFFWEYLLKEKKINHLL